MATSFPSSPAQSLGEQEVIAMMKIIRTLAGLALAASAAGCWPYGNEGAQYFHRSDTITLSAGNAKDVNAATHVIDPWPRNVHNRRIPANGERMVGAVQRYQGKGAAKGPGQAGQPAGPAGAGTPPPVTPSGAAATPSATLPY
jgi:hypothetical protein